MLLSKKESRFLINFIPPKGTCSFKASSREDSSKGSCSRIPYSSKDSTSRNASSRDGSSRKKGQAMETRALFYLQEHGFLMLDQNFKCRLGEIDLIGNQNNDLVFVEVRFRKNSNFGGPLASVHYKKQQKLIRTAEFYLKMNRHLQKLTCRFDIIGITMEQEVPKIEWIQNAFQARY